MTQNPKLPSFVRTVSGLSLAEIRERIPALVAEIGVGAAERDISGELPFGLFQLIRKSGLLAIRVPQSLGGPGGTVTDVMETLATLGSGDSNVAHSLRTHFNLCETLFLAPESEEQRSRAQMVLDGALLGGAGAELGKSKPSNTTTSTLTRTPAGTYLLNGKKYYTTGTAYADFVSTSALTDDGETHRMLLPIDRPGIEIQNDWDGMGQRLTASGGVVFKDVEVREDELFPTVKSNRSQLISRHVATFRQLVLMSCQAGSVRNVLAEAIAYAGKGARPITHSHAETAREDYFVQREVGKIASLSNAIDALITTSAGALDKGAEAILADDPDAARVITENAITAAKAQVILGPLALQAAEGIFNVGGASATSRKRNFDRHWRNIRTVMSHNPIFYKEKAVGDFLLNGEPPPGDGGYF